MKISSWNVNSLRVRLPQVLEWLDSSAVDILCLQETKTQDADFPQADIEDAGYQVVFSGQKTYNGVAILSQQAATDIVTDVKDLDDPQRRILAATIGDVRVINLYVVNGSEVGSEKFEYKLHWLEKVTAFIKQEIKKHEKVVVLGDFNITPEDRDVHDPEAWKGKILCSDEERAAYQGMLDCGLTDTFRLFDQEEKAFSWWDYRGGGFRRNHGMRIDLILASAALTKTCKQSIIDKTPRTWERPSDHTPVIAEF